MFCVLLSLYLKLLFLKAILWVPEIRDDSPRRSMHGLFHSSRFNFDKLNGPLEARSWGLVQPDSIGKKRETLILFIELLVFVK